MLKRLLIIPLLFCSQLGFADQRETTCYTDVRLLGSNEDLNATMRKLEGVFVILGQIQRPARNNQTVVSFLISLTAYESAHVREQTEADYIKRIIMMGAFPTVRIATEFQGCKEDRRAQLM